MSARVQITFLVQRIGPYHHARFRALAAVDSLALSVIEFRAHDAVYAWSEVADGGQYRRWRSPSVPALVAALERDPPAAIVTVGYSDPEVSCVTAWALQRGTPLVVCSDSTRDDEPRSAMKETMKRAVLAAYDAALVSGRRAHDYLETLGVPAARRFQPWDVVDNGYFAAGADRARLESARLREERGLPPNYFLCAARFVPKKNLDGLIRGFARYVQAAGRDAWSLVISGSGAGEAELRAVARAVGVDDRVLFPGFIQYGELPSWYGLAGAAVLPSWSDQWGLVVNEAMAAGLPVLVSDRCGCAPDLIEPGKNGFLFSPDRENELAAGLTALANLSAAERAAMGARSRAVVRAFSPEAFARGVADAVHCALRRRRASVAWPTRLAFAALSRRSVPIAP